MKVSDRMDANPSEREQLELIGLAETKRAVQLQARSISASTRATNRVEQAHDLLSAPPTRDDLGFSHSGFCQVFLPHAKPKSNHAYWRRESGRFLLMVTPGVFDDRATAPRKPGEPTDREGDSAYVGVPYGPKARLIMMHLQTEGLRSRTVNLGANLSAWMRSMSLSVTGGPRGTILSVREQCLRIARCTFTMQWSESIQSGERTTITDTKIVDGLEVVNSTDGGWSGTVELGARFHEHLREHAVPLDKRAIAHLSENSLQLDLYSFFAYRLPQLKKDTHLSWEQLASQLGSDSPTNKLAMNIRNGLPRVLNAYPHARLDITRHGLLLKPSQPAVPRTIVPVHRLRLTDGTSDAA
jgi:hypothetical protein